MTSSSDAMRYLELLAPARDKACAFAAIDHGADAVYIGADRFGARAAAGNTVADIEEVCQYAHRFGAKVYVTVNTIIYENELEATQKLISDLSRIGVDALLVQDMATLQMRKVALQEVGYAPVLHASTQMDNRPVEKVQWLRNIGFTRAVLARELSLEEIRAIHEAVPDIELEVFVHGALCVSFSGQCYASQYLLGRSANRGDCAQMCRMKFDLIDAEGKTVVKDRYLLSMKDLCQKDNIEKLAEAGATSFKIEGRLKGVDYVKNVVSAYNQRLDDIVKRHPDEYRRLSWGRVEYGFKPDVNKTFNRGYVTTFRPHPQPLPYREGSGETATTVTLFSPKALGEFVGTVAEVHFGKNAYLKVKTSRNPSRKEASFSNGDGLCFLDENHELVGFRVNRAVADHLYPFRMPKELKAGMSLYRNNDVAFEKTLKGDTTRRVIPVKMVYDVTEGGFSLVVSFKANGETISAKADVDFDHQKAKTPQEANIIRQLSKLGNTAYEAEKITVSSDAKDLFMPSSILADLRRKAVEALDEACKNLKPQTIDEKAEQSDKSSETVAKYWTSEYKKYPYLFNVANHQAAAFYKEHGLDIEQSAFEVEQPKEAVVMQCRYCIRHELGYCVRRGGKKPVWKEPLTLRLGDGHCFQLDFRCDECQMNLLVTS